MCVMCPVGRIDEVFHHPVFPRLGFPSHLSPLHGLRFPTPGSIEPGHGAAHLTPPPPHPHHHTSSSCLHCCCCQVVRTNTFRQNLFPNCLIQIFRGILLVLLGPGDSLPPFPTNETNPSLYTGTTADHNSSSSEDSLLDLMEGSFHLHSSDNFDSYLEELGVGYILRQLAALAFPIITVSGCPAPSSPPPPAPSPCRWSIQTDAGLRSHVITFLPGEGVQDTTMDGRQVGYSRF